MRLLIFFLLAVTGWTQTGMMRVQRRAAAAALTVVNTAVGQDATGSSGTTIATASGNVSAGNLLVCGVRSGSAFVTVTGLADSPGGNTFASAGSLYTSGGFNIWQWWYAKNTNAATGNVVTATLSGTDSFRSIICYQVSGASVSAPLDTGVDVGGGSTGTTYTSPSFSTANAAEIIFFGANGAGLGLTWTAGSIGGTAASGPVCSGAAGSCAGADNPIAGAEYRIVSSTQSSITAAINISSSTAGVYGVTAFH